MKLGGRSISKMLRLLLSFFLGRRWLRFKVRMRIFKMPEVGKIIDGLKMKSAPKWQYDEVKSSGVDFTDIGEVQ